LRKRRKKKLLPKIGRKRSRSQFEFDIYRQLREFYPRKGLGYEVDKLGYTISYNYIPDFTITKKDGSVVYIEAKGLGRAFDAQSRAKMIAVKKHHPNKDIRIVFMSDRPFRKGGKMRPSDWAVKYGFPFAIKTVPKEWFE
jgi:hypothetical protein